MAREQLKYSTAHGLPRPVLRVSDPELSHQLWVATRFLGESKAKQLALMA